MYMYIIYMYVCIHVQRIVKIYKIQRRYRTSMRYVYIEGVFRIVIPHEISQLMPWSKQGICVYIYVMITYRCHHNRMWTFQKNHHQNGNIGMNISDIVSTSG